MDTSNIPIKIGIKYINILLCLVCIVILFLSGENK